MQDVDDRAPADDDSPTSDDSESLRNESSLLAGVTRSAASTLRQLGISSAALGGYIRKRAFLNLGSLAAKHGPEESVISDKRAHNRVGKGEKSYKISYRIAGTRNQNKRRLFRILTLSILFPLVPGSDCQAYFGRVCDLWCLRSSDTSRLVLSSQRNF